METTTENNSCNTEIEDDDRIPIIDSSAIATSTAIKDTKYDIQLV